MFEVQQSLKKNVVTLRLLKDGKVVEGFDYRIPLEKERDWENVRKMLLKEASKRNKGIAQHRPSSR
jgi:hypothetical protein